MNNVMFTDVDFDRLSGLVHSREGRNSYGILARRLNEELNRGQIVKNVGVPKKVVTMNSQVRIRDLGTDERETFTLVYPKQADINAGRLSVMAPLGTALLGAKAGDIVEVNAPAGVRRIKIERLIYQPEAAGDLHL